MDAKRSQMLIRGEVSRNESTFLNFFSVSQCLCGEIPMIDYNHRRFRSLENSPTGEVSSETVFHYHQQGDIVWAEYSGGEIVRGQLIAKCDASGKLDMRYQHINKKGELMTGECHSTPEIMSDGRLRLHEKWQWTSGDLSSGESVIEEGPLTFNCNIDPIRNNYLCVKFELIWGE